MLKDKIWKEMWLAWAPTLDYLCPVQERINGGICFGLFLCYFKQENVFEMKLNIKTEKCNNQPMDFEGGNEITKCVAEIYTRHLRPGIQDAFAVK